MLDETVSAYEQIEQYNLVQQSVGAPNMQEAAVFSKSTAVCLPRMLTKATVCFRNFHILLNIVLRPNHVVTHAYETFYTTWNVSQGYLINVPTRMPTLFPALAVCWVQLHFTLWVHQQAIEVVGNVEAPHFAHFFSKIWLQVNWEPHLPPCYLTPAVIPCLMFSPPQSGTNTEGTPQSPANPGPGTIVRQSAPINPDFQHFANMSVHVRDVLQRAGNKNKLPSNADRVEMCLSWHIKGICNTTCGQARDHHVHATEEDNLLRG